MEHKVGFMVSLDVLLDSDKTRDEIVQQIKSALLFKLEAIEKLDEHDVFIDIVIAEAADNKGEQHV